MSTYILENLKSQIFSHAINIKIPYKTVGVFGSSGGGKTSLITMLSQDLSKQKGKFLFNNNKIDWKSIGLQSQNNQLYDNMTVAEHFELVGNLEGGVKALKQFGYSHLLHQSTGFSGGQKQLIFFIMVFITGKFKILLLDEPSSALDKNATQILSQMLKSSNKSYWIVSHDIKFLQNTCEYFIFINNRMIIESGPDIINNPQTLALKQFLTYCMI